MSLPADECGTPGWLMTFVRARWGAPDLDVAASAQEGFHQATRFFTAADDALKDGQSWACELAFCNPPYSGRSQNHRRNFLEDFTARARAAAEAGEARRGVVLVVPDTQASGWWRRNLVRETAAHVRRERRAVGDRVAWLDVYQDGELRIEVVSALGRVSFRLPGREEYGQGKRDTALVALLGRRRLQGRLFA